MAVIGVRDVGKQHVAGIVDCLRARLVAVADVGLINAIIPSGTRGKSSPC